MIEAVRFYFYILLCSIFLFAGQVCAEELEWQNPLPQGNSLNAVLSLSSNDVYAVGNNGTIMHYDGNIWERMPSGTTNNLGSIWGITSNNLFAVGNNGTIIHFNGSTWSPLSSETTSNLTQVWGTSGNDVFAVGEKGTILHYDGAVWTSMKNDINNDIRGIWGVSSTEVYAVGFNGMILRYDGTSWRLTNSRSNKDLLGVWGTSSTNIFAVGYTGTMLHFDGISWNIMNSATRNDLLGIWGSSSKNIYATGDAGTILHFNGITWSPMTSNKTNTICGLGGASDNSIYAVGSGEIVLSYEGSQWISKINDEKKEQVASLENSKTDILAAGDAGTVLHYNKDNGETPASSAAPLPSPGVSVSTTTLPSKTSNLSLAGNSKEFSFSSAKVPDTGAKLTPGIQKQATVNPESKTETLPIMEQSDLGTKIIVASASVSLPHQDYADDNDRIEINGPKDSNTGIEPVAIQEAQPSKNNNTVDQPVTSQIITNTETETLPSMMHMPAPLTAEVEYNQKANNPLKTYINNYESVPIASRSNQVKTHDFLEAAAGSTITTDISESKKAVDVSLPSPEQINIPIASSILARNDGECSSCP